MYGGDEYQLTCKNCGNQSVIEDQNAGDVICSSCGLVSDQVYISNASGNFRNENTDILYGDKTKHRQNIEEYFNYLLIQSTELIENAIKIFYSVRRRLEREKIYSNITENCKIIKVIYAYSMYEACNLANCPRYLSEFCKLCEVRESKVLQLEKTLQLEHTHCSTADYVSRTVDVLGLPYWMRDAIIAIVNNATYFDSYKSINLIAAVIILICRQFTEWTKKCQKDIKPNSVLQSILHRHKNKSNGNFNPAEWTVNRVCTHTGTNSGVVYKILRELQQQHDNLYDILNDTQRK